MSLTSRLEQNLIQFQNSQETKKTLTQWRIWFQKQGVALSSEYDSSSSVLLNWRECVSEFEQVMNLPQELVEKFTSPEWLKSQGIVIFAVSEAKRRITVQQRLDQLEDAVVKLQEQVRVLYTQIPAHSEVHTANSSSSQKPKKAPLHHSYIPKDLAVLDLKTKTKTQETVPYQMIAIDEAYLTMPQWIKVLQREGHHVFTEMGQNMEASSHRISFMQMKIRLMRHANAPDLIELALQEFEDSMSEGICIDAEIQGKEEQPKENSESRQVIPENKNINEAGLEFPPDELYQDFQTWINWFAEQGFDLQQLTAQDLTNHSSHQISFVQFCKRIARQLDDQETFQKWIAT